MAFVLVVVGLLIEKVVAAPFFGDLATHIAAASDAQTGDVTSIRG